MACLGSVAYDPGSAGSVATTSLLAMTAIDTTNCRITFTAPANGSVLVRLKAVAHGATTLPRLLLGVLDGATVKGRVSPIGSIPSAPLATTRLGQEACFVVTGLTPGNSYTWDAAYGVEILVAATAIKYGGPDNATVNDAYGALLFEVWDAPTLIAAKLYDPAGAVTKSGTTLIAMTAFDTTNLRHTFNAPPSGKVMWRINVSTHGDASMRSMLLGILDGATVKARSAPVVGSPSANAATSCFAHEASGVITGLTPGNSYTWDAAYGVEVIMSAGGFKYGGPNDTTTDNAFGGAAFELWAA